MPDETSILSSPITWAAALAAGVGVAYVVTRPDSTSGDPKKGSSSKAPKKTSKKSKKPAKAKGPKAPPSPYARFVQAQMPAMLAKGYAAPDAMRKIGELWRARK